MATASPILVDSYASLYSRLALERQELTGWLRLTLTPGVGPEAARRLLASFGLPGDIFRQSAAALREVVTPSQAAALQREPDDLEAQLQATLEWLAGGDNRCVASLGDTHYPQSLLTVEDPPVLLYLLGSLDLGDHDASKCLAIVGSRNPTPQGETNAHQFARSFGEAGLCVVSGLALGVDGAAHAGALDGGGSTIAVVGTGLDRVYPKRHLNLAHRIAANGLLVSEFMVGTPPLAANFPRRNRIIAGLSHGTLVVEAALQSGSLITARLAAEQGKDVFAIPGSIHSPQSRGCHALIKQGAKLVESAQDVLEELLSGYAVNSADNQTCIAQSPLLTALGHDPVSLDVLGARTGIDTATLQARLLELELDGHVARLPGGLFQRLVLA